MILIGVGANLRSDEFGAPPASLETALQLLEQPGVAVVARSRWFRTAPVPVSDQPWFVNGVVAVTTALDPPSLLELLQGIEARFGRVRRERNAARVLDLDLLDYQGRVSAPGDPPPILPHPRLAERAFVLRPLADVAPQWRDPRTGRDIKALLQDLPSGQVAEPMAKIEANPP